VLTLTFFNNHGLNDIAIDFDTSGRVIHSAIVRTGENCHNFTIEVNLKALFDAFVSSNQISQIIAFEKAIDR
jgi:hypothetical protein